MSTTRTLVTRQIADEAFLRAVHGGGGGGGGSSSSSVSPGVAPYTATTAPFTQPAVGATTSVAVATTALLIAGQNATITGGGAYLVSSVTDATHFVAENLQSLTNAVAGTVIPSNSALTVTNAEGIPINVIALAQTSWTVDPIAGDDGNDGSVSHPVQRYSQIISRYQGGKVKVVGGVINITILSSLRADDNFDHTGFTVDSGTQIRVAGTPTIVRSGTFTAVTVENATTPAGGTAWTVTDTGVGSWAPDANRHLQVTSGVNSGAIAAIDDDIGGNTARIGKPGTTSASGTWIANAVAVGEAYNILTFPVVQFGVFDPALAGGLVSAFQFSFLEFNDTAGLRAQAAQVIYSFCRFDIIANFSGNGFLGIQFNTCTFVGGLVTNTRVLMVACVIRTTLLIAYGRTSVGQFCVVHGTDGVTIQAGATLDFNNSPVALGIYDALAQDGLLLEPGATLVDQTFQAPGAAIIGTNNGPLVTGVGIRYQGGCRHAYSSARPPNILGKGGDYAMPANAVPVYFNTSTNVYQTPTNAPPLQTWGNLVAAQPGGYGGSAHDPVSDTHILQID